MQKIRHKIKNKHHFGFTLLEMLIVIAIVAILSSVYIANVRMSNFQKLKIAGEKMASDINYTRSMAISRAVYKGTYPGSYGIIFYNGDGGSVASYYVIYAGNKNNVIKRVTLPDKSFRLVDPNMSPFDINYNGYVYLSFISENKIVANGFKLSPSGEYQIAIMQLVPISQGAFIFNTYNKFFVSLGIVSGDNYTWGGASLSYDYVSPECGNGKLETEAGEQCDLGENNSDTGYCLLDCKINKCGDNKLYLGVEECDSIGVRTCPEPTLPVWCYPCGTGINRAVCDPIYTGGSCVSDEFGECRWHPSGCSHDCRL